MPMGSCRDYRAARLTRGSGLFPGPNGSRRLRSATLHDWRGPCVTSRRGVQRGDSRTAPRTPEKPLESFLESSPDAFVGFEPSGRIVMANRPAQVLLGYDETQLVGQSIALVLPTLSPETFSAPGEASPASVLRFGLRRELEGRRRGGTMFPVELSMTPAQVDSRRLIIGRLSDLTPSREQPAAPPPPQDLQGPSGAEALRRDEFLAMLAHELRAPLHSILGWTQLMRAERAPEMTERALEVIERNIRWQARVIDDLIDLGEILSGHLPLEVRPVRATPIVDVALARVSENARSKRIRLIRSLNDEEAEILADPARLEDVLWKLLSNAVNLASGGGQVEVRSQAAGSSLEITVSEMGPATDAAVAPGEAGAPSRRAEGALGWSLLKSLVEMMGGTVHAGADPGQGASFAVTLPLVER
jgi:PAS domain S-box-containing protein